MKTLLIIPIVAVLIFFTGCASYQSSTLSALEPKYHSKELESDGMIVGCKAFTTQDCHTYLDRDVLKEGYQPIQLTFQNTSNKTFIFDAAGLSVASVDPHIVAKSVHTSTIGRVAGYSAGGLFFPILFIPAIVDGIASSNANSALDVDYTTKARQQLMISPNSFEKTLVFIQKMQIAPVIELDLLEKDSGEHHKIVLTLYD